MRVITSVVSLLPLLACAPAVAQIGPSAGGDISYGPYPIETMQVCGPSGPGASGRAASLVIHGGAWVSEDKKNPRFTGICDDLAAHGIVAFNIDYRLIHVATGQNAWPAQLEDVQLAIRWVRAHAKDYNIDPKRVCALGTSAGGNLAALLGVQLSTIRPLGNEDPLRETGLYPEQSSQASCVVDISGPTDLANLPPKLDRPLAAMTSSLAGDTEPRQALTRISPIALVGKQSAPTLIVYGTLDRVVPPASQSLPFYQALKDKGVPVKLLEYTGHHALGLTDPAEVARALDAAAAFENGQY
jgi:acetyl esterase/lipase